MDSRDIEANIADLHLLDVKDSQDLMEIVEYWEKEEPGNVLSESAKTKIRENLNAKLENEEYQCQKYYASKKNVMSVLEKHGVAIIPSILDEKECAEIVDGMWTFLESITSKFSEPIRRDNKNSWNSFYDLFLLHSMLMQHWKIGHAQFVWNVRQNPKIASIFAEIWKVPMEELLVSFDGASFHMPPEVTKRGYYRGNDWLHCDQSFSGSDLECIQGWVTGLDVNHGDATLTFLEGSHKHHKACGDEHKITSKDDWYKLSTEEMKWYEQKGCKKRSIMCPKGSLVLWDSRTIHAGKEALKDRREVNFRCVVYVCYTPRSLITEANRKKKVKALKEMRMTTHWPHKVKLFPVQPRTYGKTVPEITSIRSPELSKFGQTLAGYK
jgi:ectoine hydroxylase-related dioxygenase (phytanoyl-CoA dioxygenase family)